MEKDFQNRKVKFYIIERKDVKKPKIYVNEERTYDDFDLTQKMMLELSNRASNDYGVISRDEPKVFLSSKHITLENVEHKRRELQHVINDIKKLQNDPNLLKNVNDRVKLGYKKNKNVNQNHADKEHNESKHATKNGGSQIIARERVPMNQVKNKNSKSSTLVTKNISHTK